MSEPGRDPTLNRCGCCEGAHQVEPVRNPPGLPALHYRLSTHGRFLERMLLALPLATPEESVAGRPLARLTARTSDDPTVALLDACASAADILTFYQERIANEGFLRTATERLSVLELARAIGYELAPGVAASVRLSFTVEDAPGAPGVCVVPKGTQLQSVPPQGKLPQVFETSADFTARAEWNALRPRLTRPAELAIVSEGFSPDGKRLCLLGPVGSFPAKTEGVLHDVEVQSIHRLDPGATEAATVDAVEVKRIYFTDAAANLAKGERLLFVGRKGEQIETLILRISDVVPEAKEKRIRVDLEPLPDPVAPEPPVRGLKFFPAILAVARTFASVPLAKVELNRTKVESAVLSKTWRERDLQAFIGIQRWQGTNIVQTAAAKPPAPEITPTTGAFSFREKVAFFGHNAPKWGMLPVVVGKGNPYAKGWDAGDGNDGAAGLPYTRTIWESSQGVPMPDKGPHAYLESPVPGVVKKSWIVIESPDQSAKAYSVFDAREASRPDYGLSGKTTALTLADAKGTRVTSVEQEPDFLFRTATARANSSRLEFAELPIASPIDEGSTDLELDRMVLGLATGQSVVLQGERDDMRGVEAAEVGVLSDVIHAGGRTTLVLEKGLVYSYVREKLFINANVVAATHGESVKEVLGSGDAAAANQEFRLKKPPLTYVSAPTPRGTRTTLEVRVNGVRWDEVPSLYGVGPNREVYTVRIEDDAAARVIFGDGVQGARLPSGAVNVSAAYRSGIGPDGEVAAGSLTVLRTMPLGLRGVTNALPASGAEGPERLDDARRNAPLTVLTFERVVSLTDYEDFARTFQGIGKALADRLWLGGRDFVHLTVAGATGAEPGADVLGNLQKSIRASSDGSQPFLVSSFAQRYFTCRARVAVDPRLVAADVLAAVGKRLQDSFGFEGRRLAQSVTAAEVIALIQQVDGVLAVDLESLAPYEEGAAPSGPEGVPETAAIPARRARWNPKTQAFDAAELLLVNPVGIELTEMKP